MKIAIRKGLELPINGSPAQTIEDGPDIRSVAVLGPDYVGMKPTMEVAVGDKVNSGQLLFTDKKTAGLRYTAPAGGTVAAINRGVKRMLLSVVIDVGEDNPVDFGAVDEADLATLDDAVVRDKLVQSGLWTALRTRPFSKVPSPEAEAAAIFVNAMDTQPLAADPQVIIANQTDAWRQGLTVLSRLSVPKVFAVSAAGSTVPTPELDKVEYANFAGPHPAGLSGTHAHFLMPASDRRSIWTIAYQDVIAIGQLFTTGRLNSDRIVALSGSGVERPRLLRSRLGANIEELCAGQLNAGSYRKISGSVFGGRTARGGVAYVGRYHQQVSVIPEQTEREFMGWLSPGANKHSTLGIYLSSLFRGKSFDFTTTTNGSERAMVPIGAYENVMPLDILPTQLLRALIVGDTQSAKELGALELDEEDLALCTYVCPGKYEYGPILRENLDRIEREG